MLPDADDYPSLLERFAWRIPSATTSASTSAIAGPTAVAAWR